MTTDTQDRPVLPWPNSWCRHSQGRWRCFEKSEVTWWTPAGRTARRHRCGSCWICPIACRPCRSRQARTSPAPSGTPASRSSSPDARRWILRPRSRRSPCRTGRCERTQSAASSYSSCACLLSFRQPPGPWGRWGGWRSSCWLWCCWWVTGEHC